MVTETNVAETIVTHLRVFPNDANPNGKMFGGRIMEIMDSQAGIAASRFAPAAHHSVTASVDNVDFRLPVYVGDILRCTSRVVYTGRTSMVIRAEVRRYDSRRQEDDFCTSAHLIFVAMNADNKPMPVPELKVTSDADRKAWEMGKAVRERLLEIKSTENAQREASGR